MSNPSSALPGPAPREPQEHALFRLGAFELHSGEAATWKIDCDALTDADWEAIAAMIAPLVGPFTTVEGVPAGGLKLATALSHYTSSDGPVLIADDVLTTGASMEAHRAGREAKGAVVFARGACPAWITPLFAMPSALQQAQATIQRLAQERDEGDECCGYRRVARQLSAEIDTLRGARAELRAKFSALQAAQASPALILPLQALVEQWRADTKRGGEIADAAYRDGSVERGSRFDGRANVYRICADQLAALLPHRAEEEK